MNTITLIRHPESDANKDHIIAKSPYVDISEFWKKTSELFVQHYADEIEQKAPLILTGTQTRSKRLVDVLQSSFPKLEIIESDYCNERNFGIFGGCTKQEVVDVLQSLYPQYSHENEFSVWMDKKIDMPWGFESNAHMQLRIQAMILKFIANNKHIRFIASTWLIRNTLSLVLWKEALEIDAILPNNKIPNLSRTDIQYNPYTKEFLYPSYVAHIPEELLSLFQKI
jgi:broad specificity phosphatase PhoE